MASYEEDLFWRTTVGKPVTKEQFDDFGSAEQVGKRLVEHVTSWLENALARLPEEQRTWFRVNLERPDWIDPGIPEQALHELQRLTAGMPDFKPSSWEAEWTHDEYRAFCVLEAVRKAIRATWNTGWDAGRVLVLIDAAMSLGLAVDQAHIVRWEPVARTGQDIRDGGDKGRQTRTSETAGMHQQWQNRAAELLETNPRRSKFDLAKQIAKEWNQQNPHQKRSAGRIRNVI